VFKKENLQARAGSSKEARHMIENQTVSVEGELDAPDGESVTHGGTLHRKLSATDGPFAETKEGLGGSIFDNAWNQGDVIDVVSKSSLAWLRTIEVWPMMAIEVHEPGRTPGPRRSLPDTAGPLFPRGSTPGSGSVGRGPDRHAARVYQTTCPVCGLLLAAGGGVLFQGDHLVHATCWRAAPQQFHDLPGVGQKAVVS
jgi:hypothetical protein